jgi:hypothetical protein
MGNAGREQPVVASGEKAKARRSEAVRRVITFFSINDETGLLFAFLDLGSGGRVSDTPLDGLFAVEVGFAFAEEGFDSLLLIGGSGKPSKDFRF